MAHGAALASCYPAFTRFTWRSAPDRFARAGRILDPAIEEMDDELAAERSCEAIDAFLHQLGLWTSLEELGVPENEVPDLARQSMVLPDYENNPRVATSEEMEQLITECFRR